MSVEREIGRLAGLLGLRRGEPTPSETVRRMMRAGQVKNRCCHSNPRCRRCPVVALARVRAAQAERTGR